MKNLPDHGIGIGIIVNGTRDDKLYKKCLEDIKNMSELRISEHIKNETVSVIYLNNEYFVWFENEVSELYMKIKNLNYVWKSNKF